MTSDQQVIERFFIGDKVIQIIFKDITTIPADVIVSSDDNQLSMSGGVSYAISRAGGNDIWNETRQYIPAPLGSVVISAAGMLSAKYVFHAIVIDFDQWKWPDVDIIQQVTKNCLLEAERLNCQTIAMPAFGTGAGSLASETAATAVVNTLFDELPKKTKLRTVILSLPRQDTLFDFLKYAIENRIRMEYEAKLDALQEEKQRLIEELRANSPYKDLPFPIAITRRTIDAHHSFHSKFTSSIDCLEAIIKYCAAIVLAERLRLTPELNEEVYEYFLNRKLTLGAWINILEDSLQKLKDLEVHAATANIRQFYYSKNKGYIAELLKIRNEVHGHGATLPESSYRDIHAKVIDRIGHILLGLKFTSRFPIVVVNQTDVQDEYFDYEAIKVIGDNIIFSTEVLRCQALRMSKGIPYLYDQEKEQALQLLPFLIFETCPHCQVQETFFLESTNGKDAVYHTHRANHRITTEKYLKYFKRQHIK